MNEDGVLAEYLPQLFTNSFTNDMKNKLHFLAQMKLFFSVSSILLPCLLLRPGIVIAETEISGRYLSNRGEEIVLQLKIGSPPPTSIIVLQRVPAGSIVTASTPAHNKFKKGKGELKWLIRQPSPGQLRIHLHLQKPLPAGSVSASIRYKDPVGGTIRTIAIP